MSCSTDPVDFTTYSIGLPKTDYTLEPAASLNVCFNHENLTSLEAFALDSFASTKPLLLHQLLLIPNRISTYPLVFNSYRNQIDSGYQCYLLPCASIDAAEVEDLQRRSRDLRQCRRCHSSP